MSDDDPQEDAASKPPDDDAAEERVRSLAGLLERLRDVQDAAREQGVFVDDRDLLTCPRCGLLEDVLVNGRLVTCWPESHGRDTGLRFAEDPQAPGRFTCPECGGAAVPDEG